MPAPDDFRETLTRALRRPSVTKAELRHIGVPARLIVGLLAAVADGKESAEEIAATFISHMTAEEIARLVPR